jgi:hypothetical protein
MDFCQDSVLLIGPTNYGLADPLQNTAISLLHVTSCLSSLEPDFESVMQLQVMGSYLPEIGAEAVNVQKKLEKEEMARINNLV